MVTPLEEIGRDDGAVDFELEDGDEAGDAEAVGGFCTLDLGTGKAAVGADTG